MQRLKLSDPRATFRYLYFTCVDATALQTRLQASDMSTFTVRLSKNGGTANAAAASAPVEVDATNAKGLFRVPFALSDLDTAGHGQAIITNAGGTKTMEKREIVFAVDPAFFFTATTGTLTTTAVLTDRSETTVDFWKDALVLALTGALTGQIKKVGAYSAGKVLTLATINTVQQTWTAAPANGDFFELINR